ncbi:glycosyltransferase family 2 protein [Verminephrobacter aporrectodeae]|uniref:glycosyltransferase family 2 protein n=1 Tax=Verminephrobacter aporrectodeae TaxID=1110389 RepID=UPI000237649C|nr:glycosyltransferase family 2 protein [Verminephrobacter aporrectodeae]MCW5222810.1 glycosyltransferase [Verminephrobacter aporrectodeae subsp. tuberculatae]MCW5256962.1 glycosyltransferase [Verminephrobacter aporrectodeae subsp. tuberculatae]MCW5288274.1 glycosyltransferase [Verminephrobacter aporrectodeae subsp. tuberculatae]MCW8173959.1 glycosyltransferase [Verminephrobacter aporrectodeae subsp. tuberculatae]MCW8197243.1 glycosyltransferase [Verminephrobacter aporrectodeae subsp. tubercul
MNKRIAVILPACNEEVTIREVILAFHASIPEASIYVIDNNSKDRTGALAAGALMEAGIPGRVISEPRQGKGNALRRAFQEVHADVYVLADADLTYPANRARDLMRPVLDGDADMVVGDRHSGGHYSEQNKRRLHGFGNDMVRNLINLFFKSNLRDVMSGYRVFSRTFVKNYAILVEGFQVETDMTLHALDKRFRIVEVPIEYVDRPAGSFSKLNTISDGARVLFTIAQILRYYRPFAFFGSIALIAMLLGLLAGVPVIHDWLTHRYIYHVPLAILAASLGTVSVGMLSIGLLLDGIAHQQQIRYELHLLSQTSEPGDG